MTDIPIPIATIAVAPWIPGDDADIPAIAHLITELGYPVDAEAMTSRLARFESIQSVFPSALLLARDTSDGEVVGLLQLVMPALIEADGAAEIWALVVNSERRGNRIGQLLIEAAESWASNRGATTLRLRTNVTRTDAHRFYERVGFAHTKTSRTYVKAF